MWALVIVCGALATFTLGVINWGKNHLEKKEAEFKAERAEDQKQFLTALATRDSAMAARDAHIEQLTKAVQEMNVLLKHHHETMEAKHSVEAETIARLAGQAAVLEYIRSQQNS
jgi:hypothetical protein